MAAFLNIIFDAATPQELVEGKESITVHHEKCKSIEEALTKAKSFEESTIHQITVTYTLR